MQIFIAPVSRWPPCNLGVGGLGQPPSALMGLALVRDPWRALKTGQIETSKL
jgi:hypothetical protein